MAFKTFKPKAIDTKAQRRIKKVALLDVGRSGDARPGYNENQFDLALGYLGSVALSDGYEVMVLQQGLGQETEHELIKAIGGFKPDVLGFTSFTYQYEATLRFKKLLQETLPPEVITVIGGIHASTSMEECAKDFDYVVFGEGEETLRELLRSLNDQSSLSSIPGLAFNSKEGFRFNGRRDRIRDLDRYGPPLRLDSAGVISPVPDEMAGFAPISFGRGCAKACTFCTNRHVYGSGKEARVSRGARKVLAEIEVLYREAGINYFYTHDEDFLANREFLEELCNSLIGLRNEGVIGRIFFSGMGSISRLMKDGEPDFELIRKLAEAGCIMIALGIERAADDDLKNICKGTTTKSIQKVVEALFGCGIAPVGLFMYGFPEETRESLARLVDYARSIPVVRYRFAPVYPLKGTVLRKEIDGKDAWLDDRFKSNEFARCEIPVLKNQIARTTDEPGYQELLDFEKNALRAIYGSAEYGKRIKEFISRTGGRFRRFFSETWKEYVESEFVGTQPKW